MELDFFSILKIGGPIVGALSVLAGFYRYTSGRIDKLDEKKVDKEMFEEVTTSIKEKIEDVKENFNEKINIVEENLNQRIDDKHEAIKSILEIQTRRIVDEIKNNNH